MLWHGGFGVIWIWVGQLSIYPPFHPILQHTHTFSSCLTPCPHQWMPRASYVLELWLVMSQRWNLCFMKVVFKSC